MRSTTPQERMTMAAPAGLGVILQLLHVVARGGPGPGVLSPTAIRADLLPLAGGVLSDVLPFGPEGGTPSSAYSLGNPGPLSALARNRPPSPFVRPDQRFAGAPEVPISLTLLDGATLLIFMVLAATFRRRCAVVPHGAAVLISWDERVG
jgi:hypothetical protein